MLVLTGLDPSHVNPAMLLPIATAGSFAIFSMLTRALYTEPADVTLFYSGLVGMVAATLLLVIVRPAATPEPWQWAAIGLVGLSSLTGHRLLVAAYRWGRASDLAPLGYLSLIWAFLNGALIFHEGVEGRSLVGAVAIAVGGVIALRSTAALPELSQTSVDYGDPADLFVDGRTVVESAPARGEGEA